MSFDQVIWLLLISAFSKNLVCSSAGPKISAFGSHSSANLRLILDGFIPNFKLKYENLENIIADFVIQLRLRLLS